jgi:hypothetical protein
MEQQPKIQRCRNLIERNGFRCEGAIRRQMIDEGDDKDADP